MTGISALVGALVDRLSAFASDDVVTNGPYADTRSTDGRYSIYNTQPGDGPYAARKTDADRTEADRTDADRTGDEPVSDPEGHASGRRRRHERTNERLD